MTYTSDQLGRLLFKKKAGEPRKNLKRYLKDCGGAGSAEELDQVLPIAERDADAIRIAEELHRERMSQLATVEQRGLGALADMLAQIEQLRKESGLSQEDIGELMDMQQPQYSAYVSGKKQPGGLVLAKAAEALKKRWVLVDDDR